MLEALEGRLAAISIKVLELTAQAPPRRVSFAESGAVYMELPDGQSLWTEKLPRGRWRLSWSIGE